MLKRRNAKKLPERKSKTPKILPLSPPTSNVPSDVLKWMKINAKPKIALKLMQLCKYFQHQNFPYFVMRCLHGSTVYQWRFQPLANEMYKNLDFQACKNLWITEQLHIFDNNSSDLLLSLLPKVSVCDIHTLHLTVHNITFEQFKRLTAGEKVKQLALCETIIKDKNDEIIPLEKIFECLPNLYMLILSHNTNFFVSHKIATEKIPFNLRFLQLRKISESFNLVECFRFVQHNQQIHFTFHCNEPLSDEDVQKLQSITDDLINLWSPPNKPPHIYFERQTAESQEKLKNLKKCFNKK